MVDEVEFPPPDAPDVSAAFGLFDKVIGTHDESVAKTQYAWCVCMAVMALTPPNDIRKVAAAIYDGLETQLGGDSKEAVKK